MFFHITVIGDDLLVSDAVLFRRNLQSKMDTNVELTCRGTDIGHHATEQSVHPPVNVFVWHSGRRRFYGLKENIHGCL